MRTREGAISCCSAEPEYCSRLAMGQSMRRGAAMGQCSERDTLTAEAARRLPSTFLSTVPNWTSGTGVLVGRLAAHRDREGRARSDLTLHPDAAAARAS